MTGGPRVVAFSGVPGTGKSTLADAIGRELVAPVFNWDWLMSAVISFAPLKRALDEGDRDTYRDVGYTLMARLIEKQLRNGHSAILDCVVRDRARLQWLELAQRYGAAFSVIECSCSDVELHQSRIIGRDRSIPGWDELDWRFVEMSRATYEPLPGEKLAVDTVDPYETTLARVRSYLGLGQDAAAPAREDEP